MLLVPRTAPGPPHNPGSLQRGKLRLPWQQPRAAPGSLGQAPGGASPPVAALRLAAVGCCWLNPGGTGRAGEVEGASAITPESFRGPRF